MVPKKLSNSWSHFLLQLSLIAVVVNGIAVPEEEKHDEANLDQAVKS